jgi:uncharacterized protein (TIGR02266 family)
MTMGGGDSTEDERTTDGRETGGGALPDASGAGDPNDTVVPSSGLRRAVHEAALGRPTERANVRVPYHLKVTIYANTEFCAGVVQNLSVSGVLVAAWQPLPVDTPVEFDLDIEGQLIAVKGVVRWNRKRRAGPLRRGMGVEFTDLSSEHEALLVRFVENQVEE